MTPPTGQVLVGGTMYFGATAFSSGSPLSISSFSWSSSNVRVATVDDNGMATGVAPGTVTITARTGSGHSAKSGRATLQVGSQEAQPQPQAAGPPAVPRAAAPAAAAPRLPGQGCAAEDREPPGSGPAVALEIDPLQVKLVKGESRQLGVRPVTATGETAEHLCVVFLVQPGGNAAAVDTFGMVLANDTGHAIIQVTVSGKAIPLKLVNVEVRNDSVRFRSAEISMVPGEVDTLQLLVPAQNNRPVNPAGFQFQSSDPTKVRVLSFAPVVTAVAAGRARIVAQSTFYPEIPITINVHRRVARLEVTPGDSLITLAIGGQTTLRVRPMADSLPVTEAPVNWMVGDTTVVRFDTATKVLRGLKMGETRIAVSVPVSRDTAISWHWHVKVIAGGLAVSRPGPKVALGVGEKTPVEVKILDDKRQPIETASRLTWTSTNDTIARVVEGQIWGVGMGRAHLTARAAWDSTIATDVTVAGELLVYALRTGRWDIYMVQRGENGQPPKVRQMTQDEMIKSLPAWSPTLMQIAYVAAQSVNGSSDLYVEDADGTNQRRLTHDSATVTAPSFVGPAGDQIVFESSKGGKAQLYVMKLDGTGRRQITTGDNPNTQPNVSPDGKRVLFTSVRDRNYDIYEIGLDGTGERRLTNNSRPEDSPAYAADGRSFYYLRDEGGNPATKRVYRQDLPPATVAPGAPAAAAAQAASATPITPTGLYVRRFSVSPDPSTLALEILTRDASGVQITAVVTFNVATGVSTPVVLSGADKIGGPAFRPATPQH